MILTVSTVKDSLDNIREFVRRNLAGGADHLIVFLDAPDPEAEEFLGGVEQVTCMVTDHAYWVPERPSSLNARQVTNANLAMTALAGLGWAEWIFHIDADEVVQIDPALLGELSGDVRVARLAPLEAVSQLHWDGEVTHFKRMLARSEIDTLVERGVIEPPAPGEPHNGSYFRGHVQGKVGVRPALDLRMQLHRAVVGSGPGERVLPPYDAPWLRHLHYESHSGEEFVRKWLAHLAAGDVRLRDRRSRLRERIEAVLADRGLGEAERHDALTAIYHDQIEDDFATLRELGLLVEPVRAVRTPRALTPQARAELAGVLALLRGADKRFLNPQLPQHPPRELFERLRREAADPLVRAAIERALARDPREDLEPDPGPRRPALLGRLRRR